jgi:ABC-type multidrug transport system ATPase subunit
MSSLPASEPLSGQLDRNVPTVAIEAVTQRWPKQPDPVLRDVDLILAPGEVAWLSGENGVGKTTLLRIIAGIITPDRGSVRVCALTVEQDRRAYQRLIGLLTAGNSGLYARMTVRQHLNYWARLALIAAPSRGALVDESIARFDLDSLEGRRLDRMSMGQRQRVRIAMTFLHRPKVLLLDEPANSLDLSGRALLTEAVEAHRAEGGSTLWCSPAGETLDTQIDQELVITSGRLSNR